MSLTQDPF